MLLTRINITKIRIGRQSENIDGQSISLQCLAQNVVTVRVKHS
jgi:hypothetical protein